MTDKEILHLLIDAWDALPGGKNYTGREIRKVDEWLNGPMIRAINEARKHLHREKPKAA